MTLFQGASVRLRESWTHSVLTISCSKILHYFIFTQEEPMCLICSSLMVFAVSRK